MGNHHRVGNICQRGGGLIQTGPFGSQLHAADYVPIGVPSIMPQNIGDNRVVPDGIARITKEDANRLKKYLVKVGDIVYSRRGDVERRALITKKEDGWLCGTGCLRVRFGNFEHVDPLYASYYLGDPSVKEWIVRHAIGATMPNLNTSILSALPFICPSLSEQRAIAGILGALDDKIELNRHMNRTLESMARAVFRQWFVENEEVENWEVKKIGEFAAVIDHVANGSFASLKEKVQLYEYPHYAIFVRTTDSRSHFTGSMRYVDKQTYDFLKKTQLNGDEFIISNVGDTGSVFRAPYWLEKPMVLGNNAILVKAEKYTNFLYHLFQSKQGQAMIDSIVSGSVQMKFNKTDFRSLKILLPPQEILEGFNNFITPIQDKITQNIKETRTLASLRDSLLPKLMRGEVRVKDVEKMQ